MAVRVRAVQATITTVAVVILGVVAVVTALPAGPSGVDAGPVSIVGRHELVIGVKPDQPGLGERRGGAFEGFDVDVAHYVAGRLGARRVRFVGTLSSQRERVLGDGSVDMVFATYSITPERLGQVTFAGPYYVAHQDILVRAQDRSIRNVRDLAGKRLCQARGSNSWRRVTEERGVKAELVLAGSYSDCVQGVLQGWIDAVSTDDLILAGYAARNVGRLRVVNAPFSNERYGVGLRKGDRVGCERVNRILTGMYQNGTAETLLNKWFDAVGLNVTTTVPEFVGCP
jgi:glutamate transport system substrate-binding protein